MEERQDKAWKLENIASFAKNKKGAQPKGEDKLSMRLWFCQKMDGKGFFSHEYAKVKRAAEWCLVLRIVWVASFAILLSQQWHTRHSRRHAGHYAGHYALRTTMHNDAGHYAEADKVATQGQLCRSCSMWYLVAALNAVVSFDQPHSKRQVLDAEISGCSCKNNFGPQNPHH